MVVNRKIVLFNEESCIYVGIPVVFAFTNTAKNTLESYVSQYNRWENNLGELLDDELTGGIYYVEKNNGSISIVTMKFTYFVANGKDAKEQNQMVITGVKYTDYGTLRRVAKQKVLLMRDITFKYSSTGGLTESYQYTNIFVNINNPSKELKFSFFNPFGLNNIYFKIVRNIGPSDINSFIKGSSFYDYSSEVTTFASQFNEIVRDIEEKDVINSPELEFSKVTREVDNENQEAIYIFDIDVVELDNLPYHSVDITFHYMNHKVRGYITDFPGLKPNQLAITLQRNMTIDQYVSYDGHNDHSGIICGNYDDKQYRVMKEVIDGLANRNSSIINSGYIYDFLDGYKTKPLPPQNAEINAIIAENNAKPARGEIALNESQMNAVIAGILSEDLVLIQGPPGTGKTQVIVEWIKYFVKHGNRILISSQSNAAVDNVFKRLNKDGYGQELLRVGKNIKNEEIRQFLYANRIDHIRDKVINSTETFIENKKKLFDHYEDERQRILSLIKHKEELLNMFVESENNFDLNTLVNKIDIIKSYIKREENSIVIKLMNLLPENVRNHFAFYNLHSKKIEYLKNKYKIQLDELHAFFIQRNNLIQNFDTNYSINDSNYLTIKKQVSDELQNHKIEFENIDKICRVLFSDEQNSCRSILYKWGKSVYESNEVLNSLLVDHCAIIGGTCIGVNTQSDEIKNIKFDVVIIDEAAQIQAHNILVPLTKGRKAILLGDHMQIPPIVKQEISDIAVEQKLNKTLIYASLFEHLFVNMKKNRYVLNTQFRMPDIISNYIQDSFYPNSYLASSAKQRLSPINDTLFKSPLCFINTHDSDKRFENFGDDDNRLTNDYECQIIVDTILALINTTAIYTKRINEDELETKYETITPANIGVITPYSNQKNLILKSLDQQYPNVHFDVRTLDSFQGEEKEIIIYDLTKSNKKPTDIRRIGFLNETRRFNVAMTRAKNQIIIVGDLEFFEECKETGELDMAKKMKELHDYMNKTDADLVPSIEYNMRLKKWGNRNDA